MTADEGPGTRDALGPLGRRLLAAFVLVALSSVAVLTVAALVGTDRGLVAAEQADRQRAADRAAEAAAQAYARASGWRGADLSPAQAVADGVEAQLVVRDAGGATVWPGMGMGAGQGMHASGSAVATAPVVAGGERVGSVRLAFRATASAGRTVAWSWVAGAGAVALAMALAASFFVSRRLTAPLLALARTARSFAEGDRTARSGIRPPGELGELARAFDRMADDVARAETVRRRLSADVAHELRTPLAALRAGLEELRDGLREPDPARLGTLHDQALRLSRVVADLAELSSAESAGRSLRKSDVDLARIAGAALDAQEPPLRAAGLRVRRDIPSSVVVTGDADRLHQAVSNLLANAARYCRPGDSVTVRVAASDGQAVAQVADTGPGIPEQDLPHVFERLWRGPGSRTVAGSGIGLAVVRELVTAHGGSVTAESAPGRGSVFTITLPMSAARSGGETSSTPSASVDVARPNRC